VPEEAKQEKGNRWEKGWNKALGGRGLDKRSFSYIGRKKQTHRIFLGCPFFFSLLFTYSQTKILHHLFYMFSH
jgi:hypothetical protein